MALQQSLAEGTAFPPCDHAWVYYVDVASRAIHDRRCKVCGCRESLAGYPEIEGHNEIRTVR
jgi:hypothetical protein